MLPNCKLVTAPGCRDGGNERIVSAGVTSRTFEQLGMDDQAIS